MADTPPAGDPNANLPQMRVMVHYVKDLSFENPGAPEGLRGGEPPQFDLGVDIQGRKLDGEVHEVQLLINATATRGGKTLFIAELSFAGLFELVNFDDAMREQVLLIECPRLLFPFARRVLADAVQDGGYPPLMLEPIDFAGLYRQQKGQGQTQPLQDESGGEPPAGNA